MLSDAEYRKLKAEVAELEKTPEGIPEEIWAEEIARSREWQRQWVKAVVEGINEYDEAQGEGEGSEDAATEPPNLRTATGIGARKCLNCGAFKRETGGGGKCTMFGDYPVRTDQVCDEWIPIRK